MKNNIMKTRIKVEHKANGDIYYTPQVNEYSWLYKASIYSHLLLFLILKDTVPNFWRSLYKIEELDWLGHTNKGRNIGEYDTCTHKGIFFINNKKGAEELLDKYKAQIALEEERETTRNKVFKQKEIEAKRIKKLEKTYYIKY